MMVNDVHRVLSENVEIIDLEELDNLIEMSDSDFRGFRDAGEML
jgi:hypothetical protein